MLARFVLTAAAALTSAAAFAAGPAKPGAQLGHAQPAPTQVVLASAAEVQSPVQAEQPAPSPPKRPRIARVTSCRCGDPQPQPQQ